MTQGFQVLSHTADIGISVEGKNEAELFQNAAYGMLSLLTDPKKFAPRLTLTLQVASDSWENLLVNWLQEILFVFTVKRIGLSSVTVLQVKPHQLKATVAGEKINPKKHSIQREIKAVTYHDLKIVRNEQGLSTRIIFDI